MDNSAEEETYSFCASCISQFCAFARIGSTYPLVFICSKGKHVRHFTEVLNSSWKVCYSDCIIVVGEWLCTLQYGYQLSEFLTILWR